MESNKTFQIDRFIAEWDDLFNANRSVDEHQVAVEAFRAEMNSIVAKGLVSYSDIEYIMWELGIVA